IDGIGNPYLAMRDTAGVNRLQAYLDTTVGVKVSILNSAGLKSMGFMTRADGAPVAAMMDQNGFVRFAAEIQSSGEPRVTLGDSTGAARMLFDVTTDGLPILWFTDSTGTERVQLGIGTEQEGYVAIYGANAEPLILVGDNADGPQTILLKKGADGWLNLLELKEALPDNVP
ncbi:MAG TPA: hypothetical protein VGA66_03390, partial [Mycobacterium sp.]